MQTTLTPQIEVSDKKTNIASPKELYFGFAKRHQVLLQKDVSSFSVLYTDKTPLSALIEVRRYVDEPIHYQKVTQAEFNAGLVKHYEADASTALRVAADIDSDLDMYGTAEALQQAEDLLESEDDAPIIKLINAILGQALKEGASDIHIETYEDNVAVRFRIDGVLQKVLEPNRRLAPLLVSRVKVMAKLDISEKRVPQDGRIAVRIGGRAVDVRVSTMPSNYGERVVMRLLEKDSSQLDLTHLGLSEKAFDTLDSLIHKPHGILLVTGPTGAGKTTTLYAALSVLNESTRNILTVEDPIEYELPGIGQTQVNTKVGMTFAKGLRAILRQDPDIVMVGEIRDIETAEIAIQASLTGHLVLSTLHTNTAIGAITPLRDMGVERFLLSTSIIGVIGQRLVRLLCSKCKEAYEPGAHDRKMLGLPKGEKVTLFKAHGCDVCNHSGYGGRTGIYEIIAIDESLKEIIHEGGSEHTLKAHVRNYYDSMRQDGIRRVIQGETTIEEVMRVTTEE